MCGVWVGWVRADKSSRVLSCELHDAACVLYSRLWCVLWCCVLWCVVCGLC